MENGGLAAFHRALGGRRARPQDYFELRKNNVAAKSMTLFVLITAAGLKIHTRLRDLSPPVQPNNRTYDELVQHPVKLYIPWNGTALDNTFIETFCNSTINSFPILDTFNFIRMIPFIIDYVGMQNIIEKLKIYSSAGVENIHF